MRKTLLAALAGCAITMGAGQAAAQTLCSDITTIGGWSSAGSCVQGDKIWTYGSSTLDASIQVLFGGAGILTHNMQIIGFDTSDAANSWTISYDITVSDPTLFYISDMFAGADNPGGGSDLTKTVTGDPGGAFVLTVADGAEGPASEKHGLTSIALHIVETFSVDADANLLSVSNTYLEKARVIPTPGTLALLGIGMLGFAAMRRRKSN